MVPGVFRTAPIADGLRDSEWEKSTLKMVTVRVVQFRSGTSKLLSLKTVIEENPHTTIPEICERCDVSTGTAARIVCDDLSLRKIATRWTPPLRTDQQNKQRVEFSRIQDPAKTVNSELHTLFPPAYQHAFDLGSDDWNCVCEAGESNLKV